MGVAALATLASGQGRGQDALQVLKANQAAAEARRLNLESQPYTLKAGELRMLAATSLEVDWNDNVNAAQHGAESDFIVRPAGQLTASYPVTQSSLLSLNVQGGYNKYLEHDVFSYWYVGSGSGVALDLDAGQFTFDVHDRMQETQDSALNGAVAGTGLYGTFQNTAGVLGAWDLNDFVPSIGYDHQNYIPAFNNFNYLTYSAEDFYVRTPFRVHPRVSVGPEATAALTSYEEPVLNNNTALTAGLFGDWRPNSALRVTGRGGYVAYLFEQTSTRIKAQNLYSWYGDLTASDQVTDKISASVSAGHQFSLGIQSQLYEAWYVNPGAAWRATRDISLRTSASCQYGTQSLGVLVGNPHEDYNWESLDLGLDYSPRRNLKMSLDYRLTLRSSNLAMRSYTQDQLGLLLSYSFQ
jgi:hypothetical protein